MNAVVDVDDYVRKLSGRDRLTLAGSSQTSARILFSISSFDDSIINSALLENPNVTAEVLDKISYSKDIVSRMKVAKHSKASSETLRRLAFSEDDISLKQHVAANLNTPQDALQFLSDIHSGLLGASVAYNINCPENILVKLFKRYEDADFDLRKNDGYEVFYGLSRNPNTPENILTQIALISSKEENMINNSNCYILDNLRRNSNAPQWVKDYIDLVK